MSVSSDEAKRRGNGELSGTTMNKKLKLASPRYEDFKPGAMIKMRLENFITYRLTEFDLSPSLNMIIGPNGSGKSTFVCAVCLGLAGKPELIGRSKKITDFIKNGEESALIEITLKNPGDLQDIPHVDAEDEVIKITRLISRQKNKNEYFINGQEATEAVVRSLVARLNIQLDNLCQFLSQERVASFAGLKSEKLLVETLRSIDTRLCDILTSLTYNQSEETRCQTQLNSRQKRLDELRSKRNELQGSVEQLRKYQEKRKEIDIHKKLIPYVRIKDVATKRRLRRAELNQAVKSLKEFLKEKSPLIALDTEVKEKLRSATQELKTSERSFERLRAECTQKTEKLRAARNLITSLKSKAESHRKKGDRIQADIANKKQELEQEKTALNTVQVPDAAAFSQLESRQDDLLTRERPMRGEIRSIETQISNKSYEMSDLKRRIESKQNSLNQNDRIGVLDHLATNDRAGGGIFKTVKDAVKYVRDNPEMQRFVLEPPAIAVSVSNPRYAAYLAQCVDFNTRIAFTLVGSQAYDKFGIELLDKFRVNTRELSGSEIKPTLPREQLERLGFKFYLSDIVTGDSDVIKMLCQTCNIHAIPIALQELTPQQVIKLMEPRSNGRPLFTKFIHGDRVVDMGIGAYSRQVWTKDYECTKKTDFFQTSVMSDELKSRIRADIMQLQAKVGDLSRKIDDLEATKKDRQSDLHAFKKENEKIAKRLKELGEIRSKYTSTRNNIRSFELELEELIRESKRDLPTKLKEVEDEISSVRRSQTTIMSDLTTTIRRLKENQKKVVLCNVKNFEARNLDASISDVIVSVNRKEQELNNECNSRKQKLEDAKKVNVEELKNEIKSYTDEMQEQLHVYVEKYDNEGTFDLGHIEGTIDKLESEITTLNSDESAVSILDQVEKETKDIEREIPTFASRLTETQELIKKDRRRFEPEVDDIVEKVSSKFSELFKQIGSKGHVALSKPDSFAEWKIEIKVAFRDSAKLTKLDAQKQSGGERAVSTVLYMIALQPFTTAPFRVVDEINQGMDPRNERIVHTFMVKNACAGNTSQYFLITPKLLTNLYYDERMMIHCVMAGPWIPNPSERPEMVSFGQTSKYIM